MRKPSYRVRAQFKIAGLRRLLLTPVIFYTRARALSLLLTVFSLLSLGIQLAPSHTIAATNSTINFQARLASNTGAIVNDGNYNIEFKLYNVSSGGTALWTEDYLNSASQGVQVINGYLSVSLGSITAFPNTINWDQNLYLTMNVGGTTTGTPGWDGEMNPRLSVTALPYAFRAGQLAKLTGSNTSTLDFATQTAANSILLPDESGTLCIQNSANCGFVSLANAIQNSVSTQTNANFNIQSNSDTNVTGVLKARLSQTADLFQAQDSTGAALLRIAADGTLIGANGSGANANGGNLTVAGGQGTGTGIGGSINFKIAKPGSTGSSLNGLSMVFSLSGTNGSALFENAADSGTAFQVQNSGGVTLLGVDTAASRIFSSVVDGASAVGFKFNTSSTFSTSGAKLLSVQNNGTEKFSIDKDGNVNLASGAGYFINGANVNTAGTLSNVAYLNQAQTFSAANTFSAAGTALTVNNNATISGTLTASRLSSSVLDGASAVGFVLNTSNSFSTAGAKLLSVQNGSGEKFSIDKDGNVNIASGTSYFINGNDINTAGTLSNVAYLNQGTALAPQIFTGTNIFRNTSFQVQNTSNQAIFFVDATNSRAGINTGAPANTLVVAGRKAENVVLNVVDSFGAGTNFSVQIAATRNQTGGSFNNVWAWYLPGSSTDFRLNSSQSYSGTGPGFQDVFTVTQNGNFTLQGTQSPSSASNGTSASNTLTVNGAKGGNTSGTTGQTAGNGAGITLNGGAGGDAASGSTNGNGGNITLSAGAAGSGGGAAGSSGSVIVKNSANSTSAFQIQNAAGTSNLLIADTSNTRIAIAKASASYTLDVGGDINTTGTFRVNGSALASTNLADASNIAYLNAGTVGSEQLFTGVDIFRNNSTSAFQIQRTNSSTTVLRADTTNGRVAINLGATAPTYTLDVGGDVNLSNGSVFRMNGTDINTAGTLSNVAYLNQANAFNAGAATGNALSVTTSGNPTSGNAVLQVSDTNGTPSGNLLDLRSGSTPASKFSVTTGGAITAAGSLTLNSTGNAIATFNTAANTNFGQILFQEAGSSRGSIQYYGSNQNASGVTNSSLALQNDNGPIIFRQNNVNTFSVAGTDGSAIFTGIQPATVAGSGTTPGAALTVNGAKGGNTSGTTGQVGGTGAGIVLTAGNGGNAATGSTNGSGGNITLSAGAPGIGGTGGSAGSVIVKNGSNSTTAFQIQNASSVALLTADTTNSKVSISGTLKVGVSNSIDGVITVANATNSAVSNIQIGAPTGGTGDATYTVPAIPGGTGDTFCLLTLGNCGASLSVSGTTNYVARFTGTNSLGTGKLYDDGNFVGDNTTTDNGQLSILSRASGETGLFVQAAASATKPVAVIKGGATPGVGGNLLELQNSASSTPLAYFDANGNLNAPFATLTGGALLQSDLIVNTVGTFKGSNSITVGDTGNATGSILFKGATAASSSIKLIGQANPTNNTLTLPNETGTLCSTGSLCSGYAPATGSTNYLGKNTNDTSSASFNGALYNFTNSNTAGSTVLSLNGAGTGNTLSVVNSANPTSGNALIFANNSNATASGNLIDLRNNGTSKFSVDASGNGSFSGTLGVTSDLTVGSSKLTVQASNGNTAIAGTLGVTGVVTASGGLSVAANQALSLAAGTGTFTQSYQNGASAGSLSGTFTAHAVNATNLNNGGNNVTLNGFTVALTGTATSGGVNTNNAINLSNIVAAANNTFNALNVGTGYNSILSYAGGTLIDGNGLLQNAALDSTLTYSNIQKVGTLTAGSIGSGFGTISTGNNITTTATIQGGTVQGASGTFTGNNAVTVGTTGTNTGAIVFKGSTAASGTITLLGPNNPSTSNYKLLIPQLTADATICTDQLNCTAYAPATGGNYIAKNASDSSSASVGGTLLSLTNTSTGASAGVLSLTNAGTSNTLSVNSSSNPAAGNALLYINNSNAGATGNLLDLRNNGTSKFSVDATGALTLSGAITVNAGISTSSGDLSLNAAGSNVTFNGKNLTSVGTINSGAITSSSTITGTTLDGTTGLNTGASGGTLRIDSSGNLVNIGNYTSSAGSVFSTTGANGFTFKPGTDNTNAFVLQRADGLTNLFILDTGTSALSVNAGTTITGSTTGNTLKVTSATNPAAGSALIFASNTNASPSGSLLDLQSGSSPSSKFKVLADGSFTSVGSWTQNAIANATQVLNFGAATNFGQITFQEAGIARGSLQYTGSNAGVSGVANNSLVLNNDNGAVMFHQNGANTFSVANDGTALFSAIQPASLSGTGTTPGTSFTVTGAKGGNTSGTTGQTAGTGGAVVIAAGNGGDAASGSTNGNGGTITLQGGAAGSGTGSAGNGGGVLIKNLADSTTAFRIQNANASINLLTADSTGSGSLVVGAGNFQAQNSNGWQELNLDNTNNNLIANPSFETNANGWAAHAGSGSPARNTIEKYIGTASGSTAATATNNGMEYAVGLGSGQPYALGLWVKFSATASNGVSMGAATSTTDTPCTLNGGTTPTILTTGWTYLYCTFTATAGQDRIFIKQTTATTRTIFVDGVQLLNSNSNSPYKESSLSINSVITSPAVFQNQSDSTTAFQIQATSGTTLFGVDTANSRINISNGTLLTLDSGIGNATLTWNSALNALALQNSNIGSKTVIKGDTTTFSNASAHINLQLNSNGAAIFQNAANSSTAFQIQNANGAQILNIDSTSSSLAVNGGCESGVFTCSNWTTIGGGTASRDTTLGEYLSGASSMKDVTSTTNPNGPVNSLGAALSTNTTYVVSMSVMLSSGSTSNFDVRYYRDGTTQDAACSTGNSGSSTLNITTLTTSWQKLTCYFKTSGSAGTTGATLGLVQTDTTSRTIFVDNLSIIAQNSTGTLNVSQLKVGGLSSEGLTLLTVDSFGGAPNDNTVINPALYGSMYFDTTAGSLQCYGTSGWANCSPAPSVSVNLIPEYVGVVLNGSGVGTMTSNICSGTSKLSINTSVCAATEDYNYYQWTSPQATNQTYSLYVRYQLPATFKNFSSSSTITLTARTSSTTDGSVAYTMYKPDGTLCGSATTVTSSANTWQTVSLGGDETTCGLNGNDIVMFKIDVTAKNSANVYVSNLSFLTLGK